jgi:hypothetical protein
MKKFYIFNFILISFFLSCQKPGGGKLPSSEVENLTGQLDKYQKLCKENKLIHQDAKDHLAFIENGKYLIYTIEQLESLALDNASFSYRYKLMTNIDLDGKELMIGSSRYPFQGEFDGSFCEIKNLSLSEDQTAGLFGHAKDSVFENFYFKQAAIKSKVSGILGAKISDSKIKGVVIENSLVFGEQVAGALVGALSDSEVSFISLKSVSIKSDGAAGGVIGHFSSFRNESKSILNFFGISEVNVKSAKYSGGLIGVANEVEIYEGIISAEIKNSVESGGYSAGVVGNSYQLDLNNIIFSGSIEGDQWISNESKLINSGAIKILESATCKLCENQYLEERFDLADKESLFEDWDKDSWVLTAKNPIPKI